MVLGVGAAAPTIGKLANDTPLGDRFARASAEAAPFSAAGTTKGDLSCPSPSPACAN
jgi:hypothetical protein